VQTRYFDKENNVFVLDNRIRQMVQFLPLNLVSDEYPTYQTRTMNQDIIICRNVTIYFDEATTRSIVKRFYESLTDGGWLMVGHAEPLASTYQDYTVRNFPDTTFYQKVLPELPFLLPETKPLPDAEIRTKPMQPKRESQPKVDNPQMVASQPKANHLSKPAPQIAPEINIQMVRAAVDKEDWDTAMSLLSILESQTPMDSEVHYLRGLLLMHGGKLDAARQALRRALYCDPSYALAHYTMGEIAVQEANPAAARRAWRLAERAVAGLGDYVLISESDGLTTEMFRSLLTMRLSSIGEQQS